MQPPFFFVTTSMGAAQMLWSNGSNPPSAICCSMASSIFSCNTKGMGQFYLLSSVQFYLLFQLIAPALL